MKSKSLFAVIYLTTLFSGFPNLAHASYAPVGAGYGLHFGTTPLGWVDADMSKVLINQAQIVELAENKISFPADNPSLGFRQIQTDSVNLKAGIYGGWYQYNGSFAGSLFGAGVTIMPVAGSSVTVNRFVANEKEAEHLPQVLIPAKYQALNSWRPHDSISYQNRGGIIFAVGAGFAFTGLAGDFFAAGDWKTYVEKIDASHVYVKVTNIKITSMDIMVGNFVSYGMLSDFKKTDNMFSYIFDLSDPRGQVAYEAMVHGSIMEAQDLNAKNPTLAELILTEDGGTSGIEKKFYFGLPFLNVSHDSGNLINYSNTVFHQDNSQSDVEYGLYWSEGQRNLLGRHRDFTKSFYATSYVTTTSPTKDQQAGVSEKGIYGTLTLSYENDNSGESTIKMLIGKMVKQTGMRNQLQFVGGDAEGTHGYLHLSLTLNFPEAATRSLMSRAAQVNYDVAPMENYIEHYFNVLNDPEDFCRTSTDNGNDFDHCKLGVKGEARHAIDDLRAALVRMNAADKKGDRKAFVQAYSKFGEAMLKNEFVFALAEQMARTSNLSIIFEAEGESISQVKKAVAL